MKSIAALIITLLISVSPFQEKQTTNYVNIDEYYTMQKMSHVESYAISNELKDTIGYYTQQFRENINYAELKTEEEKFKYFGVLIPWHLLQKQQDSVNFLLDKMTKENLSPKYNIWLNRTLGVHYDHLGNITASLECFLKAMEKSLEHNLETETYAIMGHLTYIIQNRFPITPNWLKHKEDILNQIKETYLTGTGIDFEYTFKTETPSVVIFDKIHTKSVFYPDFETDLTFVKKNLTEIELLQSNWDRTKESLVLEQINTIYLLTINYFDAKHKKNNLYYNLLSSYIKYLTENGMYEQAITYINELDEILPEDIGYDYFDYSSFYEKAVLAHKQINDPIGALYYLELDKSYENRNSLNSEQTYNYLRNYINLRNLKKIELQRTKDQQRNVIIVIFGLTLASFISLFLYLNIKNNKKLRKINEDLKLSRNEAIETLAEKRKLENRLKTLESMVSKDLHDNFGNKLSGILNSFEIMKDINERENLNSELFRKYNFNFEKSIVSLTSDVKDLLWANNPSNNSLNQLIDRLMNIIELQTPPPLKVIDHIKEDIVLPRFWNRQIFLLLKEAITNASKHSKSNVIELTSRISKSNQLIIECKDYGIGLDLQSKNRISGIDYMEKRANSIEGELQVISEKNNGTSIIFISAKNFNNLT